MNSCLAIQGGAPVRSSLLPYGRQSVDENDIRAVVEVLRSDWLTTGPKVAELEEAFASYVDSKHAVAFSSGTAALHATAFAANLSPGDEVITTPMTFVATANCALYQGARPVFVDVQPDTLNLDPHRIEQKITSRTRGLIPVDYAGQPADWEEILNIAARHALFTVEDAAHALGARYRNRRVGSQASMTVFSLHPVKHITSGEGGIVTTNDAHFARQLRIFRNHGITSDGRERQVKGACFYEMVALGFNYRITDIQCALGISQLQKVSEWIARRRAIAARYHEAFRELPELEIPWERTDREHAWHLYVLRLNLTRLRVTREEIFRALRAENIGVNVHYIPVPWHPYYQQLGFRKGEWPIAENEYERLLSLPLFPGMFDSDVQDVIEAVRKVITTFRNL
jgi:perosamine synthetase